MFEGLDKDPEMRAMVATTIATEQCRRFLEAGIDEFHIYTLNKATVPLAICRALGLNADPAAQSAA
jgi:methylenetetrahydrofolate reductase (NADPH)